MQARNAVRLCVLAALFAGGSATALAVGGTPGARPLGAAATAAADPARQAVTVRTGPASVAAPVRAARSDLRDALGRGAIVSSDARTGGLRYVGRLGGYLTGPSTASAQGLALDWVRAHREGFGLDEGDLAALRLVRDYTSAPDGVRHLQWAQVIDGIEAADSGLAANVAADGRLINVLGAPRGDLALRTTRPGVSASAAYGRVLRSVGSRAAVPAVRSQSGAQRRTDFTGTGDARLVAYAAGRSTRLAWRVLAPSGREGDYDALVDAESGAVVRRQNLVKFATALVHENTPGEPVGGAQAPVDITPYVGDGATTLSGNNAHAFVDADDVVGATIGPETITDSFAVPADGEVPPSSGSDWLYPLKTDYDPGDGSCPASGCTWDYTEPFSWDHGHVVAGGPGNSRQAATQLFWYVNQFHDHLASAPIAFDEASGNFQAVNVTGRGRGDDQILAQADDGANTGSTVPPATTPSPGLPDPDHQDNANMDTRPDGTLGRMQMYLFQPTDYDQATPPDLFTVNGSDDPRIVWHEYTHGLSNRLVVDPQGFGALGSSQAGAMGEAWSDWYAFDHLAQLGFVTDTDAPGELELGAYVDGGRNLIRTQPLDCPVGSTDPGCPGMPGKPGGYTYGDMGKVLRVGGILPLAEVHADGEIWGETLWQLREALVAAHGATDGAIRAQRLITGAMRLSPLEPSFLDMRNAILQEDTVVGGGDQDLLWRVFTDRGMGYYASTTGGEDHAPDEDFSLPPAAGTPMGTVRGVVRDDADRPVAGVLVGLGGHDAPGLGPALQARTGGDGAYAIAGVPQGQYPAMTADAPPGYGDIVDRSITIAAAPVNRDLTVRRNYADVTAGATIPRPTPYRDEAAIGCGPERAFDGSFATAIDLEAPADDDSGTPADETNHPEITVALAQPVDGAELWIDPTAHCGDLDFSSLGRYLVSVSADGATFTSVGRGEFTADNLRRLNRVALRGVPESVRFVRVTALSTQQTILPDFGFLGIAEIQVYARPRVAPPAASPSPSPSSSSSSSSSPAPARAPAAARLRADLSRTAARLPVSAQGRATVTLRCIRAGAGVRPARCTGRAELRGQLRARQRVRTLATVRFSIPSGKAVKVPLKLTNAARRALRSRTLGATLRVSVANPGGRAIVTRRTVRLARRR